MMVAEAKGGEAQFGSQSLGLVDREFDDGLATPPAVAFDDDDDEDDMMMMMLSKTDLLRPQVSTIVHYSSIRLWSFDEVRQQQQVDNPFCPNGRRGKEGGGFPWS